MWRSSCGSLDRRERDIWQVADSLDDVRGKDAEDCVASRRPACQQPSELFIAVTEGMEQLGEPPLYRRLLGGDDLIEMSEAGVDPNQVSEDELGACHGDVPPKRSSDF